MRLLTATTRLLAMGLVSCACMAAAADAPRPLGEQVDALVVDGYERPAQSLAVLRTLDRDRAVQSDAHRVLLQAMGTIEARTGAAARAGALAEQLLALASEDPSGRMQAGSNLVRARVAETAGQLDMSAALAQSALPVFQAGCPVPGSKSALPPTCDYRSVWGALELLERRAKSTGVVVTAEAHARSALELAESAGDVPRQAINQAALALYAHDRGEHEAAAKLMAQARHLVGPASDLRDQSRLSSLQSQLAAKQGNPGGSLQALEEALALARLAQAPRLEAQMLTNLSDSYVRMGRPADALKAAERALHIARLHNDVRVERVLIVNIGVAKIGLGRLAEGKLDLARAIELWQQTGETARQAQTLREFGEALAKAGDARGALDTYHRERALTDELMRLNRSVALKDLQARNDAKARQRDIELLARDNALKAEALANRDLTQRIWWLLAAVMALAIALVAMLYRRVRETNRRLAANHVQLRAQSERDPLTNLANRRHFQSVMASLGADKGFEGALLLVDIDHFKHVNDAHGHAAGDQVLVEVAKRLNEAVRSDDLVVRWGGEEFLILAPRAASGRAEQMAARVLAALGTRPIDIGTAALQVTASIGYARFPLPPHGADVPWEQAINLADMALYTAKNQGRNRAVGIESTTATSREDLRQIEADFDVAWRDGRVTLVQSAGPEPEPCGDSLRAA